MSLNPRCRELLCGLSANVLTELNDVLSIIKTSVTGILIGLQASLAVLNIALVPLEAARAVVDAAFDQSRVVADLVPLALLLDCLEVGDMYGGVTLSLSNVQTDVDVWFDGLNQKLAFKRRLEDEIAQLNVAIARINDFQVDIAGCLGLPV